MCWGDGQCLVQGEDGDYCQATTPCSFKCKPQSCPNMRVCGSSQGPQWYFDCHAGRCQVCNMAFGNWERGRRRSLGEGNLNFLQLTETCPICLDGVQMPLCKHAVCVSCFQGIFFSENPSDEETCEFLTPGERLRSSAFASARFFHDGIGCMKHARPPQNKGAETRWTHLHR